MTPGRRFALVVVALVLAIAGARSTWFSSDDAVEPGTGDSDVVDFLTAERQGDWAAVERGRSLRFPRDHGTHPDFRQEWWYYTGNLRTREGRRFGFQLTFFRFGHGAFDEYAESAWRSEHGWMAHFAVSDVENRRLLAWQDYARGALDLAGARAEPFAVWVNGWSVRADPPAVDAQFAATLSASSESASVTLSLQSDAPPLPQGEAGYSAKDPRGDTASYYYSLPNLDAAGMLVLDGRAFEVTGRVWMDREWSTEVLSKDQLGWDWFALRLANGDTLMIFQVRGENDGHFRYAVHVDRSGRARYFDPKDVLLEPVAWWQGETASSRYPVGWRIAIAAANIELSLSAAFEDQELNLDFTYWEGVVDVEGSVDNVSVRGEGYMELTGY